jgi:hypothetical protein
MSGSPRIDALKGAVIIAPGAEDMLASAEVLAAFVSSRNDLLLNAPVDLSPASQIARRQAALTTKIIVQVCGHSQGPFGGGPGLSAIDHEAFLSAIAARKSQGLAPLMLFGVFRSRPNHPGVRARPCAPNQDLFFQRVAPAFQGAEFASDAALIEKVAAWIATGFLMRRLPSGHGGFDAPIGGVPERPGLSGGDIVKHWTSLESQFS